MSGQASVAFEQTEPVNVVELNHQTKDISEADSRASFLEKHGSTQIHNHEGQMVTVAEAMANCPPFARLVEAMGEGALYLTATQRPKESKEETEEMEEETAENKDKTDQKQGAKKPEKTSNNGQPENDITSKQEAQRAEKLQTTEAHEEEIVALRDMPDRNEAADYAQLSGSASQASAVEITSAEKAIQTASREFQPAENPAIAEAQTTSIGNTPSIESQNLSPLNVVVAEAPLISPVSAETKNRPVLDEEAVEPAEANVTAVTEIEELGIRLDKTPQVDKLYQVTAREIDLEVETGQELPEEQMGEDFILPLIESQDLNILEYSENSWGAVTELSVPIEGVEQAILRVGDSVEKMKVAEAEQAYQILDEVVHKLGETHELIKSDSENPEMAIEPEDMEEKLKELFIQLFDHVETEHSQELIEACMKLALRGKTSELIAKIDQEDEKTDITQERGTHEAIKQLLTTIIRLKKSILHAYQVGKSALQLYSRQLALASI